MTTGRKAFGGLIATLVTALALAVPAFGATPMEIYKDYAVDGKADANYSKADLERALKDPTVQGYRSPVVVTKIKKNKPKGGEQKPKGEVLGKKTPPSAVAVEQKGGLPFTGVQLGLFTVVGLALVGSGFLLRLTGRKKSG